VTGAAAGSAWGIRRAWIIAWLGLAGLGWWSLSPAYIELDVPTPLHDSGVKPVWEYEARERVRFVPDGPWWELGCDFVVRRFGLVDPRRHEWKTRQAIFEHFDRWLTARGWVANGHLPISDAGFPEDRFVSSPESLRVYRRRGDSLGSEGRVVVAVWPWAETGSDPPEMFVVLTSTRPSFWRRLQASFD